MSAETFWAGVALYNEALWPVQEALILVAAFLTYRVIAKPGPKEDCILFASGVYGLVVLIRTWKARSLAGRAVLQ